MREKEERQQGKGEERKERESTSKERTQLQYITINE